MATIKKIEWLVSEFITPNIKQNYPLYVEFLKSFGKYLDDNNYGKILNIDDNLDAYTSFSELLDLFLDETFQQTFDFDVYGLTDENKQRYIDLAERINGLKGNEQSFAIFFQTLTDYTVATESGNVQVDSLGDIVFSEPTDPEDIYQYNFSVTIPSAGSGIEDLIQTVHPAGMLFNITGVLHDSIYDHDSTINYNGEII